MEEEASAEALLLECEKHVDWRAAVTFQCLPCEIAYCESTDIITIAENHPSRDTARVLLNIPSFLILNVETKEESKERQKVRKTSDAIVKNHFTSGMTELKLESGRRLGKSRDRRIVYSRSNPEYPIFSLPDCVVPCSSNERSLDVKSSAAFGLLRNHADSDRDDPAGAGGLGNRSYLYTHCPFPDMESTDSIFLLHYVKIDPSGKLRSIHSLELTARSEEDVHNFKALMCRLLARIYEKSAKNMLIFVSPVSGTGDGETVLRETLLPVLHFSRHTMQVIVTTRAHHCEDYIADVNNLINEHFVIVAVGGDGMIHEVVNGLHRRKLTLLKKFREMESQKQGRDGSSFTTESSTSKTEYEPFVRGTYLTKEDFLRGWDVLLPLVATVPSGSGCGLAKTLDETHPLTAALGLIHCSTVTADLFCMRFTSNSRMIDHHEASMSSRARRRIESNFQKYEEQNHSELKGHRSPTHDTTLMPFLSNGKERYDDAVSFNLGAPYFSERIAFMSLSYGMLNDIDRGSEHLRWMGNTRFAVYGCFCILRGAAKYKFKLRYLRWETKEKKPVEKLEDGKPLSLEIPVCTSRSSCPHCMEYSGEGKGVKKVVNPSTMQKGAPHGNPSRRNSNSSTSSNREKRKRPTTVLENDSDLLQENFVDFDDDTLPWKVIEDEMYLLIICGIKDISKDVIMAPLAHLCDGGMDIVFCKADPRYGRKEFLQLFSAIEEGTQLSLPFVSCVRATAAEIEAQGGLIMADGEMMPMSRIRVTKMRRGIQYVRCNF